MNKDDLADRMRAAAITIGAYSGDTGQVEKAVPLIIALDLLREARREELEQAAKAICRTCQKGKITDPPNKPHLNWDGGGELVVSDCSAIRALAADNGGADAKRD